MNFPLSVKCHNYQIILLWKKATKNKNKKKNHKVEKGKNWGVMRIVALDWLSCGLSTYLHKKNRLWKFYTDSAGELRVLSHPVWALCVCVCLYVCVCVLCTPYTHCVSFMSLWCPTTVRISTKCCLLFFCCCFSCTRRLLGVECFGHNTVYVLKPPNMHALGETQIWVMLILIERSSIYMAVGRQWTIFRNFWFSLV